ncbi:hypothetical protein [Paenibacillus mendelii]|uniref:DUF4025 domain-containing protein n=1 Tax=Paenibacillus mendelii TaxID=206163 RepID=A0ABV6J2D9_9BACL|nr:hypothetical protein [Paenibacillus mendelii]MCQ6563323.1 hypothetical protein [Paenibacillus mendelii]
MPSDKIDIETDGDPKTIYEDTTAHERSGFILDDTEQSGKDNKKPYDEQSSS